MGKKTKNLLKTAAKFILSGAALYWVFSRIGFREVLEVFKEMSPGLVVAALLFFVLSKTIAAFRLNRYFHHTHITPDHSTNLKLYLLGMFYNLFLPGGIGGDGYKIFILQKRYEQGMKRTFSAVLIDRLSGMFALAVLAVILFQFLQLEIPYYRLWLLLLPLGFLLFWWVYRLFFRPFSPLYWSANLYSLGVQSAQLCCALLLLMAMGQSDQHLPYLFVFLISSIVAVLPISIGGIGARELTFLYGAQWLGLDARLSVAVSLMFYLITAFVSLWGIIFVFAPIKGISEKTKSSENQIKKNSRIK